MVSRLASVPTEVVPAAATRQRPNPRSTPDSARSSNPPLAGRPPAPPPSHCLRSRISPRFESFFRERVGSPQLELLRSRAVFRKPRPLPAFRAETSPPLFEFENENIAVSRAGWEGQTAFSGEEVRPGEEGARKEVGDCAHRRPEAGKRSWQCEYLPTGIAMPLRLLSGTEL